jgi:hypothetical protein
LCDAQIREYGGSLFRDAISTEDYEYAKDLDHSYAGGCGSANSGGPMTFRSGLSCLEQSAAGLGCTTNTTIALSMTYTPPSASSSVTVNFGMWTIVANGTPGFISNGSDPIIAIKTSTPVTYSTTYTPGTCGLRPTYTIYFVCELFY